MVSFIFGFLAGIVILIVCVICVGTAYERGIERGRLEQVEKDIDTIDRVSKTNK